jgi:hypothetical protein
VPCCARNNHPKANPRHLIAKRSRPSGPHQPSLQFLNSDATPLPPEKKQSPSSLSLKPIHGLSAESPCMNRSPCPLVNYTNHQKLFDYSLSPVRNGLRGDRPHPFYRGDVVRWASGPYREQILLTLTSPNIWTSA